MTSDGDAGFAGRAVDAAIKIGLIALLAVWCLEKFRNPVMPSATVSGFVLTNLDERVKVVDVALIARGDARSFTFVAVAAGN